MLFAYKSTDKTGQVQEGSVEAPNADMATVALQRRGLFVINVAAAGEKKSPFSLHLFDRIKIQDVVMMSRQISTLFEAKVSVVETFRLLASEAESHLIREKLTEVMDDIKGGITISDAMAKHPDLFSDFYVSMVRSGEESGKLSETFGYLADYLDRSYALTSKARNALIYPAFVVISFLVVMSVMIVFVIPRLGEILKDTNQELPIYTKVVLGVSNFISNYWALFLALIVALVVFLVKYLPTKSGKEALGRFKLSVPYVGELYRKLYLSRISDNLNTMIVSGVSMVRALEITSDVVDNDTYKKILLEASASIKGGSAVSDVLSKYDEVPKIMVEMMRVGEETGRLGYVLETMSKFYQREVDNAVETLVGLIEPFMIVFLGLAVGILLTSVLVPIYNVASGL